MIPLDRQIRMGILLWRERCGNTEELGLKIKPENSSQLNEYRGKHLVQLLFLMRDRTGG